MIRIVSLLIVSFVMTGCVSTVIGAAGSVVKGAAKATYKVGETAVGVVAGGDDDEEQAEQTSE